ncbi:FAD-dependent monooxygenase [Pseudochrobactrum sp. sp1633]|uniref:FAD-dependent monooxygenase n=1 Tax=Pseudochrobactrum sp. sp1633 TaxID=3036706 RepID=UPI0025A4DCD5|nr:FAD-dependent monooxygenase [Pseudochrobactrum sp. sp1633]MDM8344546.1 FAD-dependent monooxygenase [Pseudochrobactrum sp. sp1633]HWD13693.1 FAD-dependent monooxygenase [Pseudochrobactrum sp.]
MNSQIDKRILIAGAGLAGLTTALALADRGFSVLIMEKALALSEVGAGLQLAPNATRLLERLGVMEDLLPQAVSPDALYLMDGVKAQPLMRMELGARAAQRWQAPYITCHRADLQAALLKAVRRQPLITLHLGANVLSHHVMADKVTIRVDLNDQITDYSGQLLLGCDGVWSAQRSNLAVAGQSAPDQNRARFTNHIAWRTTLPVTQVPQNFLSSLKDNLSVSAWLGHGAHLIAYPIKNGEAYNFVAITDGEDIGTSWDLKGDSAALIRSFTGWSQAVTDVLKAAPQWTFWPMFQMPEPKMVIDKRFVLLGDASHAMTPFAAQGAAMAVEDAASLAAHLSPEQTDHSSALAAFERQRLARIAKVARRGQLNRIAYHAGGPLALGRNLLFKLRKPESFLHDLDWLYQYDAADIKS